MTTMIARLAAALALAVGGDAFAAAQMYQQQACNPQPQAEAAASAAHPASSAASDAPSAATKKVKRPSPASSAPATPR